MYAPERSLFVFLLTFIPFVLAGTSWSEPSQTLPDYSFSDTWQDNILQVPIGEPGSMPGNIAWLPPNASKQNSQLARNDRLIPGKTGLETASVPKWLDYSGNMRLRYESKQNFDLIYNRRAIDGRSDNDDEFLLTRFRLNLDIRPNPYIHAHFTFQDAREFGSEQLDHDFLDSRKRNIWENENDLHEAWVKLKLCDCPLWIQAVRRQSLFPFNDK